MLKNCWRCRGWYIVCTVDNSHVLLTASDRLDLDELLGLAHLVVDVGGEGRYRHVLACTVFDIFYGQNGTEQKRTERKRTEQNRSEQNRKEQKGTEQKGKEQYRRTYRNPA